MRLILVALGLLSLTGCFNYGCGEFDFTGGGVDYSAGEWCGLFGSYGYHYLDTDQVYVIIDPDSADDDTVSAVLFYLVGAELRFPHDRMVKGEVLTMSDGLDLADCHIAPGGVGSGSITFFPATSATVKVGKTSNRTSTGDWSVKLDWELDCGSMQVSGSDLVDIGEEGTELR